MLWHNASTVLHGCEHTARFWQPGTAFLQPQDLMGSAVLQDARLFSATVAENISFGLPRPPQPQIEAAASAAAAAGFIDALPGRYDAPVSDGSVSGGQRQRLAIARALLRQPHLLVLALPARILSCFAGAAVSPVLLGMLLLIQTEADVLCSGL